MATTTRKPPARKPGPTRHTNWFAIWVSVAVVVVIAVVAVVVVAMNNSSSSSSASFSGQKPSGAHIDSDTGAISFGSGSGKMATYVDFMCPICNEFEQTYGSSIQSLLSDKTITLQVHPIGLLDESSQGTEFSSRAASAMYAISMADYSHAYAFLQAMYANQPKEGSTGLTDDQIIAVAKSAGVNMTSDLQKAITANTYVKYVQYLTPKTPIAPGSSGIGTPTIVINGTVIANTTLPTPDKLGTLFSK